MKYNIVLCYHGFTPSRSTAAPFRSPLEDFKNQINLLRANGYGFVTPVQYVQWYKGTYTPATPIACIMIDDGLSSIDIGTAWLIEQQIPFGIAIISRRQRKHLPEDGFASWGQIKALADSGYCELMLHTHNLHHLTIGDEAGEPQPVLDGPVWIDPGDVLYRPAGDPRMFFDWSFVDGDTWGFPMFGSDPADSFATPITSTLIFKAKATGVVTHLRLFAALHVPAGAGYECTVQMRVNGALLGTFVVAPKNYETRTQWQEREFYSITLPATFAIVAGTQYTLSFATQNAGRGLFRIYAVPDFAQTAGIYDWRLTTTAQSAVEGMTGADYVDYPAGATWPARPAIILAFAGGAHANDGQYQAYVDADFSAFAATMDARLNATWLRHRGGYNASYDVGLDNGRPLNRFAMIGTYTSGQRCNVRVKFTPAGGAFVAETLRVRWNVKVGDRYPAIIVVYISTGDANGPWAKVSTFACSWKDYGWQEFDLDAPTAIGASAWLRFETQNVSPHGVGLMTAYMDSRRPIARYDRENGNGPGSLWDHYFDYAYTADEIKVYATELEQSDMWPIGINESQFYTGNYWYYGNPPFAIGDVFIDGWSTTPGAPAPAVKTICYPFGSFYQSGDGTLEAKNISAINPVLETVLAAMGINSGFTIWPTRTDRESVLREPDLRSTAYTLSRLLIYGDQPPRNAINNILAYTGILYEDVQHGGVQWQVSIEPDPAGAATVRRMVDTMAFAAFDAWFLRGDGTIASGALNDGGTYGGIAYADDKAWLQSRGVRCLLIISNYNDDIGDVDPDIGSAVVNDPDTYVPLIVAIAVNNHWDGITINLEAVPAEDRAAATEFFRRLGRAMHVAGKLLHCTSPAPTGTDYDADWWVGWCDHGTIVQYVDAIKIMTYSESGDDTLPAPHAPDAFFQQVYDRIDAIIPENYRRRILVGCNSFGHTWDATSGEFASFHSGMAEGFLRSAYISTQDSEATWSAFANSAYYGTPETLRRAIRMATERNYGGIGVWRADTGDLYQHYPATAWLGRGSTMAFIDIRFPVEVSLGATGGPTFSTSIVTGDGGNESRSIRWDSARRSYTVARNAIPQDAHDQLLAFFMIVRGKGHSFRFKDWLDFRAINQLLGAGDGVTVAFQLLKKYTFDTQSVTRKITKPVQGTVVIYLNGVRQNAGYTVNHATGLITFTVHPGAGVAVTADFEFDVQVRFDTDEMLPTAQENNIINWRSIALSEVRR